MPNTAGLLSYLTVGLLILTISHGDPIPRNIRGIGAAKDVRYRALYPKDSKSEEDRRIRDGRTLIFLMPKEDIDIEEEIEETTHRSPKTKRCKTPTRRVRLSSFGNNRNNIQKTRQINNSGYLGNYYKKKGNEEIVERRPSVRIISLRNPKGILRSSLEPEYSREKDRIGNQEENIALLKVLEDNLKLRGYEDEANSRKQRGKSRAADDNRYVCYCRKENDQDVNSSGELSGNPPSKGPLIPNENTLVGNAKPKVIENKPPIPSVYTNLPDNQFNQGLPILYPNLPQIPQYPIGSVPDIVGANLPAGENIGSLPYMPVVYNLQPRIPVQNIATNVLPEDAPVKIGVPLNSPGKDFMTGNPSSSQKGSKRIFPCPPVISKDDPEDNPENTLSDAGKDGIVGAEQEATTQEYLHSFENSENSEDSKNTENSESSQENSSAMRGSTSEESNAKSEQCMKLYGRKVCVISGTSSMSSEEEDSSSVDDASDLNGSKGSEDYSYDSHVAEDNAHSDEYDEQGESSDEHEVCKNESDSKEDSVVGDAIEPRNGERSHEEEKEEEEEEESNPAEDENVEKTLDYNDIQEVTSTSFTSKAYDNETNVSNDYFSNIGPTSYDEFYVTGSGTEETNISNDENEADDARNEWKNAMTSHEASGEKTQEPEKSEESEGSSRTDLLGDERSFTDEEVQRTSELYEETTDDTTLGNTDDYSFKKAEASEENSYSNVSVVAENPKVGQANNANENVQESSLQEANQETQEEKNEASTPLESPDETSVDKLESSSSVECNSNREDKESPTDEQFVNPNDENVGAAPVTIGNPETYDEQTNGVLGVTPGRDIMDEDESWKAILPFCDNKLLQNAIKTVINKFVSSSNRGDGKLDLVTVGAAHAELLEEVLDIPNLKDVLSVPQIENMIVENVKDYVSSISGVSRQYFSNKWATNIIRKNLGDVASGMKSVAVENSPTMAVKNSPSATVEERQFKNGVWETHLATVAPVPEEKEKSMSQVEELESNMKNLLQNPVVGSKAQEYPAVKNMILESARKSIESEGNNHSPPLEETVFQDVLENMLGQMKNESDQDAEEKLMETEKDKPIEFNSTPKNEDEIYYDDDSPDKIANKPEEESNTDSKEVPRVSSTHDEDKSQEMKPIVEEDVDRRNLMISTSSNEQETLGTTISSYENISEGFNIEESTTDTSKYKLIKELEESNVQESKVLGTNGDYGPESSAKVKELTGSKSDRMNPITEDSGSILGSQHTTDDIEVSADSVSPGSSNFNDAQLKSGSPKTEETIKSEDLPLEFKINDGITNEEEQVGDSPTKYFSPEDRVLNYIKNHRIGSANVVSSHQNSTNLNVNAQKSIYTSQITSRVEYSEKSEKNFSSVSKCDVNLKPKATGPFLNENVGLENVKSAVSSAVEAPITEGYFKKGKIIDELTRDEVLGAPQESGANLKAQNFENGVTTSVNELSARIDDNYEPTTSEYLRTHEVTTEIQKKITKTTKYFQKFVGTPIPKETVAFEETIEDGEIKDPDKNRKSIEEEQLDVGSDLVGAKKDSLIPDDYKSDTKSIEDYTYLGKIVKDKEAFPTDIQSLQQSDLFFIGDGVKLPLEIRKQSDGSYALSISRRICEHMLKKECPCCVPREGHVVRSLKRDAESRESKAKLPRKIIDENDSVRVNRPIRRKLRRQTLKPIVLTDRMKRSLLNDSDFVSMPVEVFAKKYNLSLDLESPEKGMNSNKRSNRNRFVNKDKAGMQYSQMKSENGKNMEKNYLPNSVRHSVGPSVRSSVRSSVRPVYKVSKRTKGERSFNIGQDEFGDFYVLVDNKPIKIKYPGRDTGNSDDHTEKKNKEMYKLDMRSPAIEETKAFGEDQEGPVRYRYQRNVDNSGRRTEVATNILKWLRDLFVSNSNNHRSR